MSDLFSDKAADWDQRPIPQQISEGVFAAIDRILDLAPQLTVLDFGAGTGLLTGRLAPRVARLIAVDVSASMLAQLEAKTDLGDKVETACQDIITTPLTMQVDLIVSAMAMHHVEDTRALLTALYRHVAPGGRVALADLDTEDGTFHPPGTEGVFHAGFDRGDLSRLLEEVGFTSVRVETACEITRDGRSYTVFVATAHKPPRDPSRRQYTPQEPTTTRTLDRVS